MENIHISTQGNNNYRQNTLFIDKIQVFMDFYQEKLIIY